MNRYEIKKIVMEILIENERDIPPRSGRDLFWYCLKDVFSVWIYMLSKAPIASVWWADDVWHYSIPICSETGNEESREDAMARVEAHLAESKSAYIAALG